jgi:heme oxygenase
MLPGRLSTDGNGREWERSTISPCTFDSGLELVAFVTLTPMIPLSARLKAYTREHHQRAERAGVIRAIADGSVTAVAYRRYLRNLYAVYAAMERRLGEASQDIRLDPLTAPALARAPALTSDLEALAGPDWRTALPEVAACRRYVLAIESAGLAGLIAHAYVRYLGDLNGGRVLRRFLQRALELPDRHLGFYRFPAIAHPAEFADRIRALIDALPAEDHDDALTTAAAAFELNIALATEVLRDSPAG